MAEKQKLTTIGLNEEMIVKVNEMRNKVKEQQKHTFTLADMTRTLIDVGIETYKKDVLKEK